MTGRSLALVAAALLAAATLTMWRVNRTSEKLVTAEAVIALGRGLYDENCASCHGANLQGQPDWKIPLENGRYPAPPHDATGHTWHHDDAMLTDYIRRGGQAVLDGMGVSMTSGMPAFGEILTDGDIAAILAFIKSTWPDRIRAIQADLAASNTKERNR